MSAGLTMPAPAVRPPDRSHGHRGVWQSLALWILVCPMLLTLAACPGNQEKKKRYELEGTDTANRRWEGEGEYDPATGVVTVDFNPVGGTADQVAIFQYDAFGNVVDSATANGGSVSDTVHPSTSAVVIYGFESGAGCMAIVTEG